MNMRIAICFSSGLVVCSLLFASCKAIKIETGATAEEQTASNTERSSNYKREWSVLFNSLGRIDQIRLLQRHIDSTAFRYVSYGKSIAEQWKEGSAGRGAPISDDEMRVVVDQWIATQKALLDANDEILEYGLFRLKEQKDVDPEIMSAVHSLADRYYDCHGTVFLPSGTAQDYENRVFENHRALEDASFQLSRLLQSR
jgi:hypothetical protein